MNNEPVAWMYRIKDTDNRWELTWNKPMTEELFDTEPLYTHPVKELTDEEILSLTGFKDNPYDIFIEYEKEDLIDFAREILRKEQGD